MALDFRPYPFPEERPQPSFDEQYMQPVARLVGALSDYKQRQTDTKTRDFQMQLLKAKEAREQGQYAYDYGDPSASLPTESGFPQRDPRMSLYQPATMGAETSYGNMTAAAQPDSMAPRMAQPGAGGVMQRFRSWQENRRNPMGSGPSGQDFSPAQLMSPAFGAKRREDYFKSRESLLKGRSTEADTALKQAQAQWYGNRPTAPATGGSGLTLTPEQSEAVASGDPATLAQVFPTGIPMAAQTAAQTARAQRATTESAQQKREAELRSMQVPGWTLASGARVDETESRKARDAQAQFDSFRNSANALKKLVSKYGTVELTGPESGQMKSLVKDLQLTLKNIAQLGVLSASDIPFLTEQVGDVNTIKALGTKSETYNATLDQTLATAENKLDSFMSSRGYTRAGGRGAPGAGSAPLPSLRPGEKIKVSNGKETLWIDPADAADAARDGYQSVS